MQIVQGLDAYPSDAAPSVAALGAFDGIHLAHQKILGLAAARARETGRRAVACTFDPPPLEVLQPDRSPIPITTLDERLELIAGCGIETAVVIRFTLEFSRVEPEAFVREVLRRTLRADEVVVGFNHRFGRAARGDARLLETLGATCGLTVHVVPPLSLDGVPVSSSAIRDALRAGRAADAARFLGRPYAIRGRVARGAGRGRQLGFPTANIRPDRPLLLATGVYAGHAEVGGATGHTADRHRCVVNIGYRPTFDDHQYWVEVYLLDFTDDIYDRTLTVRFVERLREERRFPDVEALRSQIRADIAEAARLL